MIHSILHQIWNQRRSNGWLFAELLIVFTLMWYCVDVLYGFAHAERQPKGYDLEHVYKIRISCNPTAGYCLIRRSTSSIGVNQKVCRLSSDVHGTICVGLQEILIL